MGDVVIDFDNVSFSYGTQTEGSLSDINFKVKEGEFILLTGQSGSGKTTVTRLINGLIPHFFEGVLTGTVKVLGSDIKTVTPGEMGKNTASIFQNPRSQFFTTNSTKEVAFALENYGIDRDEMIDRVNCAFHDLEAENLMDRDMFSLSSGEKQKIAIIAAKTLNPKIYVFDEPSANLDIHSIIKLKKIMEWLKKQGHTVIVSEHRLFYLKNLVDKSNIGATSCGENDYNNIILENYTITRDHIDFKLNLSDGKFTTKLKGKHNLFNIMFATAIAEKLGLSIDEIRKAIEKTSEITHMRLESIPYGKDSLIINDAYNASPTSMKASVDVVSGFDDFDYKTLVLGSMFELGSKEVQYHSEVGEYISNNSKDIDLVISVGDLAKNITDSITNSEIKKLHFSSNEEVSNYLKENKHTNEVILFKASRSMKLESIIEEINK